MKEAELKIYGAVTGVGFRFAVLQKAKEFGIRGFVRNEPDRSVYIKAGGEEKNLADFVKWCRRGPALAKVQRVDLQLYEERERLEEFCIHY